LPEHTAGISEFNSKNFIKIEQEINSGQFIIFEKLVLAKINDTTVVKLMGLSENLSGLNKAVKFLSILINTL
jgi:hypothetical protein